MISPDSTGRTPTPEAVVTRMKATVRLVDLVDFKHFAFAHLQGRMEKVEKIPGCRSAVHLTLRLAVDPGRRAARHGIPKCEAILTVLCVESSAIVARNSLRGDEILCPRLVLVPVCTWKAERIENLTAWKSGRWHKDGSRKDLLEIDVAKHQADNRAEKEEENADNWDW